MRPVSRFNREKLSRLIQVQGPNAIGTVHLEEHHQQMHGGSLPREVLPSYVSGLRTEPIAFEGKLFGRMLPS